VYGATVDVDVDLNPVHTLVNLTNIIPVADPAMFNIAQLEK
jgi:hypothetical protein